MTQMQLPSQCIMVHAERMSDLRNQLCTRCKKRRRTAPLFGAIATERVQRLAQGRNFLTISFGSYSLPSYSIP
jgi:hypothetical protein